MLKLSLTGALDERTCLKLHARSRDAILNDIIQDGAVHISIDIPFEPHVCLQIPLAGKSYLKSGIDSYKTSFTDCAA